MSEPTNWTHVLSDLHTERDTLQKNYKKDLAELDAAISAISKLNQTKKPSDPLVIFPKDYRELSMGKAAEDYLEENGKGLSTPKLWEALAKRGISSESRTPHTVLYNSLARDKGVFWRHEQLWKLSKWKRNSN